MFIKDICNYLETVDLLNNNRFFYPEWIDNGLKKRQSRNLLINNILETEDNVNEDYPFPLISDQVAENYLSEISFGVKSILSLSMCQYVSDDHLYYETIKELDNLTTNSYSTSFDKIPSNIYRLATLIAVEGRMGPAKSMIVGFDIFKYLVEKVPQFSRDPDSQCGFISMGSPGIKVIPTDIISRNKAIIIRNSTEIGTGLNVVTDRSLYTIFKTPDTWNTHIKSFEIT